VPKDNTAKPDGEPTRSGAPDGAPAVPALPDMPHGTQAVPDRRPQVKILTMNPTPYVGLPRRISFVRGRVWRERLCTFMIFSFLPTVFFWIYFSLSVWPHISKPYSGLRLAAPITSLWITFGPVLMQQGGMEFQ
jgi:hypothetical protein